MSLPILRQRNRRNTPFQQFLYASYMLTVAVAILLLLSGCNQTSDVPVTKNPNGFSLPTPGPTPEPSPVSTRVMPIEVLTPPPTPSITPIPDEALGLVVEVLDGNTIAVVMDGDPGSRAYQVKYVGIASPSASNNGGWSAVAKETNTILTKLKIVRLVRDETDFDDEGYLLRHVYVDNSPVSITLLEQGLASAAITPPDVRFATEIAAAEARARAARAGMWGAGTPTPTAGNDVPPASTRPANTATIAVTPATTATITITATITVTNSATATEPEATVTATPTTEVQPTAAATATQALQGP